MEPTFKRTVIYVCSHGPDGALGLILNRPLADVSVAVHLEEWAHRTAEPPVLFRGGPVERDAVFALGMAADPAIAGEERDGWIPAGSGHGLVNLGAAPDALPVELSAVRFYLGYAGWGAGQLDGEVREGAWFTVSAEPGDTFSQTPERLYHDVLRRQRGELSMYALFPDDPRSN